MNLVTLFDYDTSQKGHLILLGMLVNGLRMNCIDIPYRLHVITSAEDTIKSLFPEVKILPLKTLDSHPQVHKNIRQKLFNVCALDFEFIFLDYDMYVNADLKYLWDRRHEKPFIAVNHQKNIFGKIKGHHIRDENKFLNSGVQIVSDPSFLNYKKIFNFGEAIDFKFTVSGHDQALLHTYFSDIKYDYTHPEIGSEWNSCAGYGIVDIDENYNFDITYKNGEVMYPVKINHYWDEFKPWLINCPIYSFFKEVYE